MKNEVESMGNEVVAASFEVLSWYLPGRTEEIHENPVRMVSILAKILLNMVLEPSCLIYDMVNEGK
jgi:hypothetical protein